MGVVVFCRYMIGGTTCNGLALMLVGNNVGGNRSLVGRLLDDHLGRGTRVKLHVKFAGTCPPVAVIRASAIGIGNTR